MFKSIFSFFAALLVAAAAQAQGGYKIKPGDTLSIEVLEDENLSRSALVLPDGSINFPLAGGVAAAGRTVEQVRNELTDALTPNFAAQPRVFVSVNALAEPVARRSVVRPSRAVYVMGEISAPGKLEATRNTTLLQALAQAGGLTRFAAEKRIQLRRGNKIYLYNYRTNGGSGISGSTVLAPGDVIVVPQRRLFE
ncbi:polysaccharide biosynthesis/export family protein [Leisingera sp.]|jgi:polysaccharide export outer membrane protein|uniref:polysaccharide biosynthesis/export family protein n=1 Tax=Leisingera sp. TaxID=1879318 RepID=UPI00243DF78C